METKGCTTIEQSKRLVELGANPRSADMSWYRATEMYPYELHTNCPTTHGRSDGDDLIPCWSSEALCALLPNKVEVNYHDMTLTTYKRPDGYEMCYVDVDGDKRVYAFDLDISRPTILECAYEAFIRLNRWGII